MPGAKWTAEADLKVLLYAVKQSDPKLSNEDLEEIAKLFSDGRNANAVGLVAQYLD